MPDDTAALAFMAATRLHIDAAEPEHTERVEHGTEATPAQTEHTVPGAQQRAPSKPAAVPGGIGGVNERTKQLASARLPPGLQAKLAANARRSALPPGVDGSVLDHTQKLDASILKDSAMPRFPMEKTPGTRRVMEKPNRAGLRLSDISMDAHNAGAQSTGAERRQGTPQLRLGRIAPESAPFANFSKILDPSGKLNFDGKAVLHASGVEFKNGTSFHIKMEELELQEQLGFGNYGTVSKVRHTRTKVEMAMKEIRLELDEAKLNAIIMELDILHRATGPQIVEFYGAFFMESCVYYCMEYMDVGSLDKLCYGRHCTVPESVLARIAACTVKGLRFLKDELQIIHRDVKPTNILVNRRGEIKLCDFGVSGQLEKSLAKTNIGCQSYMAPERIEGGSERQSRTYTTASDVWSLGLSLIEITMGVYPYPPETYSNVFAQLQAIVEGDAPQLPYAQAEPLRVARRNGAPLALELGDCTYSDTARDFVSQCLCKVPEERPSYAALMRHPFLVQDELRIDEVDVCAWITESLEKQKARLDGER
ncbi:mitogen-activated protein kinase kinase [Malassezia vespertilionis]|uniref:mitogen-activated protein kinase kinase n=1 Tax=Malassezia vespertilionis TaxID=2020962 RepID=A0A2N1JA72_9BASI|nr:mitogen-activated protein kinase kinase [Malassezia vespertilionis]PKI83450.1 hypothetical protein MVES_002538 [Malassezia vespertilionis]WFD07326.1 mitogen-activated protein kinase kinase [Malassezia vespertilionis]